MNEFKPMIQRALATKRPGTDELFSAIEKNLPIREIEKIIDDPQFDINDISQTYQTASVSPLGAAAYWGRLDVVNRLLAKGPESLDSGAFLASSQGNFDVLSAILNHAKADEEKYNLLIKYLCEKLSETEQSIVKKFEIINVSLLIKKLKAKYFINIAQSKIIHKFYEWLQIQRNKFPERYPHLEEFIDKFFSIGGYCNGLTWLFLYKTAQSLIEDDKNKIESFFKDLYLISESDFESGKADKVYEEFFKEIILLQDANCVLNQYTQKDFIENIGSYFVTKQFVFSELMEEAEIVTFLPEYITDVSMIRITNSTHVIGLVKMPLTKGEKEQFVIYDPNDERGRKIFSTIAECAAYIKEAIGKSNHAKIEFNMRQYSLTSKKPIFDAKEEKEQSARAVDLLEKIYKSRLNVYNSRLEEYKVDLEKYNVEIAKAIEDSIITLPPNKPEHPINARSAGGRSSLYLACQNGSTALVMWYLKNNPEPAQLNDELWIAAQEGYADIVDILLSHGAKYDYKYLGQTPLEKAAEIGRLDVCKSIVSHVEKLDSTQPTTLSRLKQIFHSACLHKACTAYQPEVIDFLMQKGADAEIIVRFDKKASTALNCCVENNRVDAVRQLLRYSRKNLKRYQEKVAQYKKENSTDTSLERFPGKSDIFLLDFSIYEAISVKGYSVETDPLYLAVEHDRKVIAEELIIAGANPNHSLFLALNEMNKKVVVRLVGLGAVPKNNRWLFRFAGMMGDYAKVAALSTLVEPSDLDAVLDFAVANKDVEMALLLLPKVVEKTDYLMICELESLAITSGSCDLAKALIDGGFSIQEYFFEKAMFRPSPSKELISFLISIDPNVILESAISEKKSESAIQEYEYQIFGNHGHIEEYSEAKKELNEIEQERQKVSKAVTHYYDVTQWQVGFWQCNSPERVQTKQGRIQEKDEQVKGIDHTVLRSLTLN